MTKCVCVCLILIINSYMLVAHMPPKYHCVYNVIIISSPRLGKGLMICFDWTISKSNEWVTCILRSSNVHSKSFKISQSVSETFPHGCFMMIPPPCGSPKQGLSLFFFPWILPQHRDILVEKSLPGFHSDCVTEDRETINSPSHHLGWRCCYLCRWDFRWDFPHQ